MNTDDNVEGREGLDGGRQMRGMQTSAIMSTIKKKERKRNTFTTPRFMAEEITTC